MELAQSCSRRDKMRDRFMLTYSEFGAAGISPHQVVEKWIIQRPKFAVLIFFLWWNKASFRADSGSFRQWLVRQLTRDPKSQCLPVDEKDEWEHLQFGCKSYWKIANAPRSVFGCSKNHHHWFLCSFRNYVFFITFEKSHFSLTVLFRWLILWAPRQRLGWQSIGGPK